MKIDNLDAGTGWSSDEGFRWSQSGFNPVSAYPPGSPIYTSSEPIAVSGLYGNELRGKSAVHEK
jgi:hypothetical protein